MEKADMGSEKPKKKASNLKLRAITATVYVLILLAFFACKLFVWVPYTNFEGKELTLHIGNLIFDALIVAFAGIGTWEMLQAFKGHLHRSQKTVVMVFAILNIVTYAVTDFIFADVLGVQLPAPGFDPEDPGTFANAVGRNYSVHITFMMLIAGVAVLMALLVFAHRQVSLESTGYALLSYLYPSFFLVVLCVCNHLEKYSELAILFVFVISPCADTLAFTFGKLFGKKVPAKMAPSISPNKTMIGGFGGLVGGAVGAVLVFFACYGISFLDDLGIVAPLGWGLQIEPLELVFFIALGVLTSAFSQFGDLVESGVKRKLGIKDMGKIMPGHGGILDRIDSSLYAGLIVCLAMVARVMIVG